MKIILLIKEFELIICQMTHKKIDSVNKNFKKIYQKNLLWTK